MGKNKNNDFTPLGDLLEEKKKLEKKMSQIRIPCSHTKKSGKVTFDFIKGNSVRCKTCGCVFDFTAIDSDELASAIKTVHDAINQVKAMSNDPSEEKKIIRRLGELDYNLNELASLYDITVNRYSKGGKKKKKKNEDSFGSFGANNLEFIGGGKKKNRYY